MKGTIQERVGISNMTYRRYSFSYFLRAVRRLGLTRVELSGCHPHFTIYEQERFDPAAFARQIREAGITVPVIEPEQNFLPINIASADSFLREKSMEQLKFYIDCAPYLGCSMVVVYPGKNAMDKPHEEMLSYACECLRELCGYAGEKGVTILLQNVSSCISGMTPNSNAVAEILERVGDERLALSVNTCAVVAGGETLEDYFRRFGSRIRAVQLSDSDDEDEQFILGDGTQDIAAHLAAMEKYDFTGPITLEITMEEYADAPDESYEKTLQVLQQLWK